MSFPKPISGPSYFICSVVMEWLRLGSRSPEQRTGEEALKFADECWAEGLRLSASQAIHYQLIMDVIRRTLTG